MTTATAPTSSGFLGSDTAAQHRLSAALTTSSQTFTTIRTAVGSQLDALDWLGYDATGFRDAWRTSYAPALQRIIDAMTQAAEQIRRQREQQEQASSSSGASSGTGMGSAVPGGGSGSEAVTPPSATAASSTPSPGSAAGQPVSLNVPFYSQLVAGHGFTPGNTACFKAATAMAKAAGADVLGPDQRIQVATGEHADGSVVLDPARAEQGRSYIDSQLDSGKPVVVGVSHKSAHYNVDGITDHFVVITGRGTDEQGNAYYTFNDPATRFTERGSDANPANRLMVGTGGLLYSDGSRATGQVLDRHIEVSMVRRNR